MKVGKLGWLVAMFLSGGMAVAQGTADDYRRAYALKEKFSADKVFYSNVNPQWIEGTHQFWYVRNTPDGRLYVSVDADKKARKELFDSHRLAKALGAASGKEVKPEALALGHLSVSKGLDTLRFVFNNQRWMYASRKNQLVNEGAVPLLIRQKHWMEVDDEKTASPVPSPDGKWLSLIHISEPTRQAEISYAVFCLKKKKNTGKKPTRLNIKKAETTQYRPNICKHK